MDDLYRDYILDHYKRPRNFGELEPHDLEGEEHNPLCGDELGVHIRVEEGRIADLRFHGHGCAIRRRRPRSPRRSSRAWSWRRSSGSARTG